MGRTCKVCDHPKVGEINRHIIMSDITQAEIAKRYGVSEWSISRHKTNHLGPILEEAREEVRDQAKEDFISTLDVYNMIIGTLPELLESGTPSWSVILKAAAERSAILGEAVATQPIEIVWGMGNKELGELIGDDDEVDESLDNDGFEDEYEDDYDYDDEDEDYYNRKYKKKSSKSVEHLFNPERDREFLEYAERFDESEESSIEVEAEEG